MLVPHCESLSSSSLENSSIIFKKFSIAGIKLLELHQGGVIL